MESRRSGKSKFLSGFGEILGEERERLCQQQEGSRKQFPADWKEAEIGVLMER